MPAPALSRSPASLKPSQKKAGKAALKPAVSAILIAGAAAAAVYFYPRLLTAGLGEDSPWTSYLYTYGIGGVVFVLSSLWIFTRKGRSPARRKEERLWLAAVICGLCLSAFAHGLWIFFAMSFPLKP